MITKVGRDYVLSPPQGVIGVDKTVAWEINDKTIEIEKSYEDGQIFTIKRKFLGLPAINKEAIIYAHKEGKETVRVKIDKKGRQGIINVPLKQWINDAEEKGYNYHNPKSTEEHCSGYDDQYVLPVKLYDDYADDIAAQMKKEVWDEVGTPQLNMEKEHQKVIQQIKTEAQQIREEAKLDIQKQQKQRTLL